MDILTGTVQPYAWGSTTALPDFLGVPATGEPQAELWLGAHPLAPAEVGDTPLDVMINNDPDAVIGQASVTAFGPQLPFLVKVLAAGQALSLQAHPSRAQAEAGFAREEAAGIPRDAPTRTYRDDWPKPEAICALGEFEALCGFRDPAEVYQLFVDLGVQSALALVEPLRQGAVGEVFGALLRLSDTERTVVDLVVQAARAALSEATHDSELARFCRTAVELNDCYPTDPGVLAALLMNRVTLQQYDALFLPAGNLHAYLRGLGVEIMANSDNVLRGGLTPKHIDIDELLNLLDFTPGLTNAVTPVEEAPGVWAYPTPAPEFALWRISMSQDPVTLPGAGSGRVVLVTEGEAALTASSTSLNLAKGQSAFVTADDGAVELTGSGSVFVGAPGVR